MYFLLFPSTNLEKFAPRQSLKVWESSPEFPFYRPGWLRIDTMTQESRIPPPGLPGSLTHAAFIWRPVNVWLSRAAFARRAAGLSVQDLQPPAPNLVLRVCESRIHLYSLSRGHSPLKPCGARLLWPLTWLLSLRFLFSFLKFIYLFIWRNNLMFSPVYLLPLRLCFRLGVRF